MSVVFLGAEYRGWEGYVMHIITYGLLKTTFGTQNAPQPDNGVYFAIIMFFECSTCYPNDN